MIRATEFFFGRSRTEWVEGRDDFFLAEIRCPVILKMTAFQHLVGRVFIVTTQYGRCIPVPLSSFISPLHGLEGERISDQSDFSVPSAFKRNQAQ